MKIQSYIDQSLIFAIEAAQGFLARQLREGLKGDQCTHLEAMILISLYSDKQEVITPSQLAKTFVTTPGNISHSLTRLEKRALIKRSLDEKNARSYKLSLKADGKKLALRFIRFMDHLESLSENKVGKAESAKIVESLRLLRSGSGDFV